MSKKSSSLAGEASATASVRFADGEKVLCFHGPLIYEAKIQKLETTQGKDGKESTTKYFIHYHGWNKNWDEWVPETRMLKYSETNLEKKRDLIKSHEANVRAKRLANKRKAESAAAAAAAAAATATAATVPGSSSSTSSSSASTPPNGPSAKGTTLEGEEGAKKLEQVNL